MRLAVWSGPRNISTAMMYSFANRSDFHAVDEPFYASYLNCTGLNHPMRDDILRSQSTDPKKVIETLSGEQNVGAKSQYQKHMTQHMISEIPRNWMLEVTNVFLLRHPVRVVASFAKKYPNARTNDIGFSQQVALFKFLRDAGQNSLVLNSEDLRENPETKLRQLCDGLGIEFQTTMLSWPKGGMSCDGVWARHWYGAVHNSSGFGDKEGAMPNLKGHLSDIAEQALPDYEFMMKYSL
tara:strand:+ start:429 stop:1142 length:714 start_codon:yes stop_codon:yes gene_type:complete